MGLFFNVGKKRSYIPFPKPIRLPSASTPIAGTIAISILLIVLLVLPHSKMPKDFLCSGNLNGTILKLSPTINGK
jgi:hypothetical protein